MSATAKKPRSYVASRIRRPRATKHEMMQRRMDILKILQEIHPASVRQSYYQASVRGLMDKTEAAYDKVQLATVWLRQNGYCPYGWISDATRWMRKPDSHTSLERALIGTCKTY